MGTGVLKYSYYMLQQTEILKTEDQKQMVAATKPNMFRKT